EDVRRAHRHISRPGDGFEGRLKVGGADAVVQVSCVGRVVELESAGRPGPHLDGLDLVHRAALGRRVDDDGAGQVETEPQVDGRGRADVQVAGGTQADKARDRLDRVRQIQAGG